MTVGGKCHWTRLTLVRCTVEAKNASALARLDVYSHVITCWVVWHVVRRQSASVSVDQCKYSRRESAVCELSRQDCVSVPFVCMISNASGMQARHDERECVHFENQ